MYKRVLIATDGSKGAMQALRVAVELAAVHGAELVVLHAVDRSEPLGGTGHDLAAFAIAEHFRGGLAEAKGTLAENLLAEARDIVAARPGLRAAFVSLAGDAAEAILRYADEAKPDVIVLGSRGHGKLVGLLLGSVAQKVASLARQATLIVPVGR